MGYTSISTLFSGKQFEMYFRAYHKTKDLRLNLDTNAFRFVAVSLDNTHADRYKLIYQFGHLTHDNLRQTGVEWTMHGRTVTL